MIRQNRERIIEAMLFASAVTAVVIVLLIMVFLFKEGAPFLLRYGIHTFCLGMEWNPIAMDGEPSYGIFPMIVGSVYIADGSLVLAVPLGISCAVCLVEIAPPWAAAVIRRGVELLVVSLPNCECRRKEIFLMVLIGR